MPKKLTEEKNKEWEDIFEDIDLSYIPIEYLKNMIVTFDDGKVWDIDVADSRNKELFDDIEDTIEDIFNTYHNEIENIDFRLDVDKVKLDLTKKVRKFLKSK